MQIEEKSFCTKPLYERCTHFYFLISRARAIKYLIELRNLKYIKVKEKKNVLHQIININWLYCGKYDINFEWHFIEITFNLLITLTLTDNRKMYNPVENCRANFGLSENEKNEVGNIYKKFTSTNSAFK